MVERQLDASTYLVNGTHLLQEVGIAWVAFALTICFYIIVRSTLYGEAMTDDKAESASASRNLFQAVMEKDPIRRPRLVAIALRPYTDESGHFKKSPRTILKEVIPRHSRADGYPQGRAARVIEELREEGWVENSQTRNGAPGIWRLNVERLGPIDDATLLVQAVRAVSDIRNSYPDPRLRRLITELLGQDEL